MNSGLPVVSFRLANICGPRLAIGPIPTFYKRLRAGQNCFCSDTIRDFLDMSDFLRLMESTLTENSPLGLFNVSTGIGHSIHDVFIAVCDYLEIDPLKSQLFQLERTILQKLCLILARLKQPLIGKPRLILRIPLEISLDGMRSME